jgi:hypothetical protein
LFFFLQVLIPELLGRDVTGLAIFSPRETSAEPVCCPTSKLVFSTTSHSKTLCGSLQVLIPELLGGDVASLVLTQEETQSEELTVRNP